jgi:hypothetical protein
VDGAGDVAFRAKQDGVINVDGCGEPEIPFLLYQLAALFEVSRGHSEMARTGLQTAKHQVCESERLTITAPKGTSSSPTS